MQGAVSVWKELPKKLLGQSDFTFASIMNLFNRVVLPQENAKWAERTTERLRSEILVSFHLHPWEVVWSYNAFSWGVKSTVSAGWDHIRLIMWVIVFCVLLLVPN